MAIDTREKRMSMLNMGDGAVLHTLPEADAGGIEADDRAHLLDLYSGLGAEDTGITALVGALTLAGLAPQVVDSSAGGEPSARLLLNVG